MSNPWFRMYSEFSHDPKVQMMAEAMQRRYIMFMCLRCSNSIVTLHETEIAFHLRISDAEMAETKDLFISKGFIDSSFNLLNWEKRQFASGTSNARVAKHRKLQKEKLKEDGNDDVTLPKQKSNALDTDTDTDTDKKNTEAKASLSPAKLPTCPTQDLIDLYHTTLPTLPTAKLLSDGRRKALSSFWKWVLTEKRSDGKMRATTAEEAMDWIKAYFERASTNDFLMGRMPQVGAHARWVCDLDFLLTDRGKKQVIEKTREAA